MFNRQALPTCCLLATVAMGQAAAQTATPDMPTMTEGTAAPSPTQAPTAAPTQSQTAAPTQTPTAAPTQAPTPTATPGTPAPTPTAGSAGTATPSGTPTASPLPTSPTPTPSPSDTPPTPAPTHTPVAGLGFPAPGEVIFSELFIDPAGTGERLEFVELKNLSGSPLRLQGCVLIEGSADTTQTCATLGGATGNCDIVEGDGFGISIASGGFALLAQTADMANVCGLRVDQDYNNNLSMVNTKPETIALYCPDPEGVQTQIAAMTYNWRSVDGWVSGATYHLDPDKEGVDPTSADSWCVTRQDAGNAFCTTADGVAYGSPRADGDSCVVDTPPPTTPPTGTTPAPTTPPTPTALPWPWPAADQVIFTELFIDPSVDSDRHEFMELRNETSETLILEGCYLLKHNADTTAVCNGLGGVTGYCDDLAGAEGPMLIEPGQQLVLAETVDLGEVCSVAYVQDYSNNLAMVNTKPETLSLLCPDLESGGYAEVFSFTYSWPDVQGGPGQSYMLDPLASGPANDPSSWCATEAIESNVMCSGEGYTEWASPGQPNPECGEPTIPPDEPTTPPEVTDPYPAPGEIIFTELFIDPPGDDKLEFIELKNLADGPRRLQGCTLIEGSQDTTTACPDLDGLLGNCDDVAGDDGPLVLEPGAYALLAQSAALLGPEGCGLSVQQDYNNALSFANNKAETVSLYCPDSEGGQVQIASITFDWGATGGTAGETWALDPAHEDDPGNPLSWCTADEAQAPTFCSTEDGAARGTPGSANTECPARTPPPPPEPPENIHLVFTEIMVGPTPSTTSNADRIKAHEWFEWVNQGSTDISLAACYLEVDKLENVEAGTPDPELFYFSNAVAGQVVTAGQRQLWAREGCLISQKLDDDSTECLQTSDIEGPDALSYGSVDFSNSAPSYLALYCLDSENTPVLIDKIEFDYVDIGEPKGRSLQLDPTLSDPSDNDDPNNWCLAPLADEVQLYALTSQGANFGTPGHINSCAVVEPPPPPPTCGGCFCRLDTTGKGPEDPGRTAFTLLMGLLGLLAINRRPRG